MKSLLQLSLVASLLLSVAGCSDDDHPNGAGAPVPLRECPDHDYSTCDTREVACQKRLLSLAACVFGSTEMPDVPIRVLTEDELREELESEASDPPPDEATKDVVIEAVLRDLELVEEGALSTSASIDDLVERFDGLYRDAEHGIVLLDRGGSKNSVEADVLLLHELLHALQDAEYDLGALSERYATTTDSALAWRALVEGEATWYQYRVAAAMLGYDTADFDFSATFDELRSDLVSDAQADSSPYIASFGTFPYAFGTSLMYEAWRVSRAGFEAELFATPPLTTLEIMNLSLGIDEPSRTLHEFVDPTASDDFVLLDHDAFGDWMLNLSLSLRGLSSVRWLGDHIWIYTNADGAAAWLWEIQLEHAPSTLADALQITMPEHVSVEGRGQRLFVSSGTEAAPFLLEAGRAFLDGT
jgi:hypothetical protein